MILVERRLRKDIRSMYKPKAQKIINELKENLYRDETEETRLYIETWVIGALSMIEAKMNGETYYPYYATYKMLFDDFKEAFLCKNISERIEKLTKAQVITPINVYLLMELQEVINA